MAQHTTARRTIDHEEIRNWAEERGGQPSIVASTRSGDSGMLRVDFDERRENLEQISWDEFFRIFEENDLAFIYQEETADNEASYFNKFVARTPEDERSEQE